MKSGPSPSLKRDPRARDLITNLQERAGIRCRPVRRPALRRCPPGACLGRDSERAAGISVDKTQITQLEDNIKKSRRDLKENVWRSYNNVALLGKNNEVRFIDLGNVHSSAASALIQFIDNSLSTSMKSRTESARISLYATGRLPFRSGTPRPFATPSTPLPCSPVCLTLMQSRRPSRAASNGQLAYVGKTASGKYHPFSFERTINTTDVEISEEMFIITKETLTLIARKRPGGATEIGCCSAGDAGGPRR